MLIGSGCSITHKMDLKFYIATAFQFLYVVLVIDREIP